MAVVVWAFFSLPCFELITSLSLSVSQLSIVSAFFSSRSSVYKSLFALLLGALLASSAAAAFFFFNAFCAIEGRPQWQTQELNHTPHT